MAEGEPNYVENNEQQIFTIPEFDHHHLVGDEFDQRNIAGNVPVDFQFAGVESENQSLVVNEQDFGGNVPENDFGVIPEQSYAENENEHTLDEDQAIHALDGNQLDQDNAENKAMCNADVITHFDKKDGHENNLAGEGEEKKWPGWPGESVFRMVIPGQKVGNVIGRKGEYIKKIVEETRARIKVLDGLPGSKERAVMVSAKEEPDASLPPAIDGLLRVHSRVVDGLDADSSQAQTPPAGGKVSTRLLVPATQAGSLIGKQGSSVKSIQEAAKCVVRVLGQADLPTFALQDDRVVEVVGEAVEVHKAIELIALQLRKFLVDRTMIPIFEKQMQASSNPIGRIPPQPWGPPHGLPLSVGSGHVGYGSNLQYMHPPRQLDNYYPPAEMAPLADRQPHQGISAFGREPPVPVHASSNAQAAPSMVTQNYIAEAAASKAATQTSGAADQGYNSYAAPPSVYGSTPSSQPGAYGSMYGGGYGY